MKQAIIYARGRKRGRLQAKCNGYRAVRVVCQTGSFPAIRKIVCHSAENIIVASPSVLGSPAYFLARRTKFNLMGKRVLIATKEDVK